MKQREDEEFIAAMESLGVESGGQRRRRRPQPTAAEAPETPSQRVDLEAEDAMFEQAMEELVAEPEPDDAPAGRELAPRLHGTPKSLRRRIRALEIEAQASLDLHGQSRDGARRSVERFLRESVGQGHEVVSIISGRGLHSEQQAVLREALGPWLNRELRQWVHQAITAPMSHGGEGVFFVFLRRFG